MRRSPALFRRTGSLGTGIGLAALIGGCWGQTPDPQGPGCAVASVAVAPTTLDLAVGGATQTVTATVTTSGCTTAPTVTWTSSSNSAVTITGTGPTVTLLAIGPSGTTVRITATAGGQSGFMNVTVLSEPVIALAPGTVSIVTPINGPAQLNRTVTISNGGGGTLTGLAVGTISYGSGATGWLTATLGGVTATPTATLSLVATRGALPEGSFTATVPISATGATNSPLQLTVTLTIVPAGSGASIIAFERWTGATYPSPSGEIWRMDPTGANQVRLTDNTTFDGYPALSPDASRIAFSTNRAGNLDLYLMNVDGTGQTGLRFSANPEVQSSWSPDGLRLVYEFIFSTTDVDLQILTLGNPTDVPFVETPQSEENPSWSPDGNQIAFAKDPLGTGAYQIYRTTVTAGPLVALTSNTFDNFSPAWSPDGSRIVYSSNRTGSYQLYVADALDGGNVVQLTTVGTNFQATWSPDGTRIAWTSGQGNDWDIWVMNADGTGKVNLTASPTTNEIGPSWR